MSVAEALTVRIKMPQSGNLCFYTTNKPPAPTRALERFIGTLGPIRILGAFRTLAEERSWERFKLDDDPDQPLEYFLDSMNLEELAKLYADDRSLYARLSASEHGRRVADAVKERIPAEIRGDFVPSDPFIRIGYHDLWENSEHEEGHLFARSFLTVGFFGYSTPSHWKEFRQQIFLLPEVQAVERELEAVTGPLERCIYWSV